MTKAVSLSSIAENNTRQMIDIIFKIVGTSKIRFVARVEQNEFGRKISEIKESMKSSSNAGELGLEILIKELNYKNEFFLRRSGRSRLPDRHQTRLL